MVGNRATLCWSATLHNGDSEYGQVWPFIFSLSPPLVLQSAPEQLFEPGSLTHSHDKNCYIINIIPELYNITIIVVNLAAQNFHAPFRPLLSLERMVFV
jgi:hypothetical protein